MRFCVVGAQLLPQDPVSPRRGQKAALSLSPTSQLHFLDLDGHLHTQQRSVFYRIIKQTIIKDGKIKCQSPAAAEGHRPPAPAGRWGVQTLLADRSPGRLGACRWEGGCRSGPGTEPGYRAGTAPATDLLAEEERERTESGKPSAKVTKKKDCLCHTQKSLWQSEEILSEMQQKSSKSFINVFVNPFLFFWRWIPHLSYFSQPSQQPATQRAAMSCRLKRSHRKLVRI